MSKKKTPSLKTISFWQHHKMPLLALFALGFVLYIYTTGFGYALDDKLYITDNKFTKLGISGMSDIFTTESLVGFWGEKNLLAGGRYRPLAIATFALEYQLWEGKPGRSHFFNIILYCLVGLVLYRVLWRLFSTKNNKVNAWYLSLPFIATALYIAHPLHSEVVASIKGRIEILASLGVLVTMYYSLKYVDTKQYKYLLASGIAFLLALLSKESAITFIGIIPLTLYYFTKADVKTHLYSIAPLFAAFLIFLGFRYNALGFWISNGVIVEELLNDPFLGTSVADKYATIFYTMGLYIKLLFFPITLTHDYYPKHIPIISWSDLRAIVPLIMYIALGVYAVWGLFKKNVVSYGILVYLMSFSIVSNLVFSIGAFMNERFMYLPSLGFCLILAYLITEKLHFKNIAKDKLVLGSLVFLLTVYSLRTFARIPAWNDNESLFLTDVKNSPNSTKVNTSAGGILLEKAAKISNQKDPKRQVMINQAIQYLKKGLELYPGNVNALMLLGNAYYDLDRNYDKVFENYEQILQRNKNHVQVHRNLSLMSEQEQEAKNVTKLVQFLENKVVPLEPNTPLPYDALGMMYGKKKGDIPNSIKHFEKALTLGFDKPSTKAGTMQDLAIAYGMSGQHQKSIDINLEALKLDVNNAKILLNIGISYQNLGNEAKANQYFERAFALDPNLKR